MAKLLKIFYAVLIGMMAVSFTACSDDDEPYDPSKPEIGTWVCSEMENVSSRGYSALEPAAGTWNQRFIDKWSGKTLKITGAMKKEGDRVWLQEPDPENYIHTETEYIDIEACGETTLRGRYFRETYTASGHWDWRESATMTFTRK